MSNILAVDCSDIACSLAYDNQRQRISKHTSEPRQHGKRLLPMFRELRAELDSGALDSGAEHKPENGQSILAQELDAVLVTGGPGSFTGLRIGFSFAQSVAFGWSKPLIVLSSLEAMALTWLAARSPAQKDGDLEIAVAIDARMGELYYAHFLFSDGQLQRLSQDALIGQSELPHPGSDKPLPLHLLGSGYSIAEVADPLTQSLKASGRNFAIHDQAQIDAVALLDAGRRCYNLGEVQNPERAEPNYLRNKTAWRNLKQQAQQAKG